MRYLVYLARIFAIVIVGISTIGCEKKSDVSMSSTSVRTFTITEENTSLSTGQISVYFSPYDIDQKYTLRLSTPTVEPLEGDGKKDVDYKITMFDLRLNGKEDFNDSIEIVLPYDESFIDADINESDAVIAMYYDPETDTYRSEDFEIDTEKNEITINAAHLSQHGVVVHKHAQRHGPFYVDGSREGTRFARIIGVSTYSKYVVDEDQAQNVVSDLLDYDLTPSPSAFEAGFSDASLWLGLTASGNTIVGAGYSTSFLNSLTNAFNMVGVGASIAQAGLDFAKGDDQALYTNLLKNGVYNTVNYLGTSALQLAFVGVFAIDYSLNTFATEALSLNEEKWYAVYNTCYKYHKKSNREWYQEFLKLSRTLNNPSHLGLLMETVVYNNALDGWDEGRLAECATDAGYSNLNGRTDSLETKIAMNKKAELLSSLQPVFDRLAKKVNLDNRLRYRDALESVKTLLNEKISFTLQNASKYAGFTVKFSPLNAEAKEENWRGTINKDGVVHTTFTMLGYMESGSPREIEIIDSSTNAIVETVPLGEISSPIVLNIDANETIEEETLLCPMTGAGAWNKITSKTMYGYCTYNDEGYLYYTYYYTLKDEETLNEEWYAPNNCGDLPAHVKYRSDYVTNTWVHYTCQLDENYHYSYEITGSGTL